MPWTRPSRVNGHFEPGQIGLVKMYAKYAGLQDQEYRELLREITGRTTSTDPRLDQRDYDAFMPALEIRAHMAEANGRSVGKRPARIRDWYYWRKRSPKKGAISSRERWKIDKLWNTLLPYIGRDTLSSYPDPHAYLMAIASHASGRTLEHIHDLKSWQALALIDALTDRIKYAIRNTA